MIHLAMEYVVSQLNDYFQLRAPVSGDKRVVLGTLLDFNGNAPDQAKNKVVVSTVNVEQDRAYRSTESFRVRPDGTSELLKPEVKINLYTLFVANLSDYSEALKSLAHVISFFQLRNAFDYSEMPKLGDREGRITFDLYSLTFEQQNHLWGALGAKYMPSVMYKAGIVDIRDEQIVAEVPPVKDIPINEELAPG